MKNKINTGPGKIPDLSSLRKLEVVDVDGAFSWTESGASDGDGLFHDRKSTKSLKAETSLDWFDADDAVLVDEVEASGALNDVDVVLE